MATDDATYKRRTEVYSTKCLVTLPWWGNCWAPKARYRILPPSPLLTGAQGTGYFPDILENGDFFLRFQKTTHQHAAYSNRFCASLENVVSLEAAFLDGFLDGCKGDCVKR